MFKEIVRELQFITFRPFLSPTTFGSKNYPYPLPPPPTEGIFQSSFMHGRACRAETGKFPIKSEAQYRNFKFWLTLTKHPKHKLSQVVYNDMKSRMNKELWSQKIKRILDQIGQGYLWTKGILKQRIQNISKQNSTRWCFSVVNKPSEQEQTSVKVNCKIRIRLLWELKEDH